VAGVTKYNITSIFDLGLPRNAWIVGIMTRNSNTSSRSVNNRPLLNPTARAGAYISVLDSDTKTVVSSYLLDWLEDQVLYIEPRQAQCIDWSRSFIQISPTLAGAVPGGEDIEIVVLYWKPSKYTVPVGLEFRTGRKIAAIRTLRFSIPMITGQIFYPLSKQNNIGLDWENTVIVGFDFRLPEISETGLIEANALTTKSTFLQIQKRTNLFIDNCPHDLVSTGSTSPKPRAAESTAPDFSRRYFPINPVKTGAVDWERSQLFIANAAAPVTGEFISLNLYYYQIC
jgi:hypothetical protein